MDNIREGDRVLYIWGGKMDDSIEKKVEDIKKIKNVVVNVENIQRLKMATFDDSMFNNIVFSNVDVDVDILADIIVLLKPAGKLIITSNTQSVVDVISDLMMSGFSKISKQNGSDITAEKPNYEIGSSVKLSFAKKADEGNKAKASAIWKLEDNVDEDAVDDSASESEIDPDELLDEEDKKKPDPSTLKVCGTTGKRKACKDCSCGLAEELAGENVKVAAKDTNQKSSCGSCYLGDAFRCASCPYLGMPAFKPGEKIQLSETLLKADI